MDQENKSSILVEKSLEEKIKKIILQQNCK